ncbi:4Fe-4S binding protein [Candidatus Methanocrinis natronophilus]|uniref:4Fe-4S binding protein n=1 Tax=Candidatus Methanocrinis natronophilus TaxID=3033396 RepID=A0ABT5X642_9EURY|nr:4Fe-4S binding protein [Candidatus Methanocrinis natronophilus]MDF0590166.1 4Fe-4S binding protein [Candidatus Methanocrinis natronophilus]
MKRIIKDRQRLRKALIIFSFVLLPVTFVYISCPIITRGASEGIVTGGLMVFVLIFFGSLFLGRLWCVWLCPAGGLQEIYFQINDKRTNDRRLNRLKYVIFLLLFVPLILAVHSSGGFTEIDPFYYTDHGISIAKEGAYTISNLPPLTFCCLIRSPQTGKAQARRGGGICLRLICRYPLLPDRPSIFRDGKRISGGFPIARPGVLIWLHPNLPYS